MHGDGALPKHDEAWAGALFVQAFMRDQERAADVLEWLQKGLSKRGKKR